MNANARSFRALGAIFCVAVSLLGSGCGSMPSIELPNLSYNQTRTFEVDPDRLFEASQATLNDMNYTLLRGSRADGKLEMVARVNPSSTLRPRQRNVEINITPGANGQVDLRLTFREAIEDESAAGTVTATNRVLRDGTLYQVFWERLAAKLGLPAPPPQAGTP